jgi:hypothetical protein
MTYSSFDSTKQKAVADIARGHAALPPVDHNGRPLAALPTYTYDEQGHLKSVEPAAQGTGRE